MPVRSVRSAVVKVGRYLTQHGWLPLLGALLVLGGIWAFLELADEVTGGELPQMDAWLFERLAMFDQATGFWQEVGRDLTAAGGTVLLTLVSLFVVGYLLLEKHYKAAIVVSVAILGGLGWSLALKAAFDRERPNLVQHHSHVHTASFPSGHSANSATVYLTLAILVAKVSRRLRVKIYAIALAVVTTFLVGASRVFVGVHWPTDVLAGWALGLSWAILVWVIVTYLQRRGAIEPEGLGTPIDPEDESASEAERDPKGSHVPV